MNTDPVSGISPDEGSLRAEGKYEPMAYAMTYQLGSIQKVIEQVKVRGRGCLSQAVGRRLSEEIIFVSALLCVGERAPLGSF